MYGYGKRSLLVRRELDWRLQRYVDTIIRVKNVSLIDGHRPKGEQDLAFATSHSKAKFGQSPHNYTPALAVDHTPYPSVYTSPTELAVMNGITMGIDLLTPDYDLTCGNDWDHDGDVTDETFRDSPHVQLRNWKDIVRDPNGIYYEQYLAHGIKYF